VLSKEVQRNITVFSLIGIALIGTIFAISTQIELSDPNATKVKIKDKDAEIAEIFGIRMLRFSDGMEIVISGKLSEEELVKIA
jgi:hypothetical protein